MTRIAIVGGGIAGLALAAGLAPARHQVDLFEAEPDRRTVGTSLGMWPAALDALDAIGAGPSVQARSLEVSLTPGVRRPVQVRTVARGDLLHALDAAVPASVHRHERRITSLADLDHDLVVGADGVHSAMRRACFGARSRSRATGFFAIRGLGVANVNTMSELWRDRRLLGLSPTFDRRTNWYQCGRLDAQTRPIEHWSDEAAHEYAVRFAERFGADAVAAVGSTPPDQVLRGQIHVAPAMWRLDDGRVVLIGDAAHAMCPNLGRGAGESLIDAAVLADALNRLPVDQALSRYRRSRVVATQAVRGASRLMLALSTNRFSGSMHRGLMRALGAPDQREVVRN